MLGGETLQIALTTGILGHVSQINTQRISIIIFHTIKASSEEILTCIKCGISPDDMQRLSQCLFVKSDQVFPL